MSEDVANVYAHLFANQERELERVQAELDDSRQLFVQMIEEHDRRLQNPWARFLWWLLRRTT